MHRKRPDPALDTRSWTSRESITAAGIDYRDGIRHVRIAGHHDLKRMLIEAGLDQDAAERDVRALHDGLVLVLYQA